MISGHSSCPSHFPERPLPSVGDSCPAPEGYSAEGNGGQDFAIEERGERDSGNLGPTNRNSGDPDKVPPVIGATQQVTTVGNLLVISPDRCGKSFRITTVVAVSKRCVAVQVSNGGPGSTNCGFDETRDDGSGPTSRGHRVGCGGRTPHVNVALRRETPERRGWPEERTPCTQRRAYASAATGPRFSE